MSEAVLLAEGRLDGVRWQALQGPDRNRLRAVAVVPPSQDVTLVEALTERQLRILLESEKPPADGWLCLRCGSANPNSRPTCGCASW